MSRPRRAASKPAAYRKTSPARRAAWHQHAAILAAIIFYTLLAYSNSYRAGFLVDNREIILEDSRVHQATAENLSRILNGPYWANNYAGLYRPLTTLSFLFDYAILGNADSPAGYHWINFGLHAANIALLYALALLLLQETAPAALLAALWAVHPVLTESVTNLVGRADLLAAFGVLACLLAYVCAQRTSGKARAAWFAAAALASALGVFSKENAAVAVAILVLYDFCFARSLPWRLRLPGYAAAAVPAAFYLAARAHALSRVLYQHDAFITNPLSAAGFWTSSLTAVKVIGKYLLLLLWPQRLSADYSYNAIPLFTWNPGAWEDWKAIFALAICAGAVVGSLRAFRRDRLPFFAVAFFFIALSPTANLVLRIGTIMAERFLYLPSVGFFILIIGVLSRRLYIRRHRNAAAAIAAVLLLAAAARTLDRNLDWNDEQRLWHSAMEAAPGSYKPWVMAAATAPLVNSADVPRAIAEMDRGLAILDPLPDSRNFSAAWRDAGVFYRSIGQRDTANAQQWYRKSLSALLRSERIELYGDEIDRRENARRGRPGLTFLPAELYLELGRTWLRLSDLTQAQAAFERGHNVSSDPDLLQELAVLYHQQGNVRAAASTLVEALGADPSRSPSLTPALSGSLPPDRSGRLRRYPLR